MPVVGELKNHCNLLVRLSTEDDFVMARGNADIQGFPFRIFH